MDGQLLLLPLIQLSTHSRSGAPQWLAEFVATFGLLLVVLGHRHRRDAAWMVAAWIGGAYWFTASTSFANPAISIARSLTNGFSGIRPHDVPAFIAAQLAGALAAMVVSRTLFSAPASMSLPLENHLTPEAAANLRRQA